MANHGVVSGEQLRDAGISDRTIRRRVADGILTRDGRTGLVVLNWLRDPWTEVAALQARFPQAVAAERTAAALFRLDGFDEFDHGDQGDRPPGRPDLIMPATAGGSRAREAPRRIPELPDEDVMIVNGLRVTGPGRTLVDLGRVANADLVERAVECALRRHLTTEVELWRRVTEAPRRGRGLDVLEFVLVRRGRGVPPTESDLETRFLQLVARPHGLPVIARQVNVYAGRTWLARRDFLLTGPVIVETDGSHHDTRSSRQADSHMDVRLQLMGLRVARVTYQDVIHRPRSTARRLLQLTTLPAPPEAAQLRISTRRVDSFGVRVDVVAIAPDEADEDHSETLRRADGQTRRS
jgi:hypothetical protein